MEVLGSDLTCLTATSTRATQSHCFPHLPHSQPASGLRRQPELCQQAAGVLIRVAVQAAWFRGDMQGM